MDPQELKRLIREQYPFPIAHAHKKTMGVLDENMNKLKCILETAEITIQFLALLALAQVRQDLLNVQQASSLANKVPNLYKLQDEIKLATPSFGKWNRMAREAMKAYQDVKELLIVPELFDFFWFYDASRQRLCSQPLDNKVMGPLIMLRNDFHHGRVPDSNVRERVVESLEWLHQFLEALQFLTQYELSFIQRILVAQRDTFYVHDLTLFTGCLYESDRRTYAMQMEPGSLIFLHKHEGQHLRLEPFLIFTDHLKGPDIFLLNNVAQKRASYVSSQFVGEALRTTDKGWQGGTSHYQTLSEFLELLQNVPQASPLAKEVREEQEMQAGTLAVQEEESLLSTAEVFQQKYQKAERIIQHTSPYKFLDYYNPEDHDIFFGRDKEIRLLVRKFHNTRLLVLHGESGTGKTSLIRAGLIPRLDPESYIPVYVRMLKDPLQEIKRELLYQLGLQELPGCLQDTGCVKPSSDSETSGDSLRSTTGVSGQPGFSLAEFLKQVTEHVSKTVVIVLDQFEEFFLRFPEEVRQQFEKELAACVETPRLDVKFLISLRADYFSSLATFEDAIPQIFTHQLQLERLTEAQALEAVIKPAERLGIQVDEPMVQIKLLPELLSEEGGIEPPLLQIVCDALYQNAQNEGQQEIGMADYEAVGDVKGALVRYLEEKLRQFGKEQRTAKTVLKALVTAEGTKRASFAEELMSRIKSTFVVRHEAERSAVGEERHFTALRDSLRTLTEEELKKEYLDKFVRHRLVRVEEIEGRARYELSHEYLVKHIEAWIEESEREVTKVLELIDRAYEAYQSTGLLLESSALQMIKPFEDQLVLPSEKHAFVDRSKTQVRKQRRGLLLKIAASLMFVALVVGGIFGYQTYQAYLESEKQRKIAVLQKQEAEQQARIAQARQLATQAQNAFEKYPQRSLLLAVEALNVTLRKDEPRVPAAEQVLRDGLANTGGIPLNGDVVAISSDGPWLVTDSEDATARLWDLTAPDPAATSVVLRGHKERITTAAISSDNHWLVTGNRDATARLWNLMVADPTAAPIILSGHEEGIDTVAFSLDTHWLVTSSEEEDVARLWDLTVPDPAAEPVVLRGHQGGIEFIAFSPDTHWLVTSSWEENVARLWDLTASDPATNPVVLSDHERAISNMAFSPDAHWLVTDSLDDTLRLWDLTAPDPTATSVVLRGQEEGIWIVAFGPDNHWLVTGSRDGTARLRDLTGPDPTATWLVLRGHTGEITTVAFSLDSHRLVTGSRDGTARLWNLTDPDPTATSVVLRGHTEDITTVAISPDTHWLVTGSWDGTARLWDLTTPNPAATSVILHSYEDHSTSMAFSPDNHWLVTGSSDKTARLWTLRLDELIELACRTAGRNLSYDEWKQYFPGEEYRQTCPDLPIHWSFKE